MKEKIRYTQEETVPFTFRLTHENRQKLKELSYRLDLSATQLFNEFIEYKHKKMKENENEKNI